MHRLHFFPILFLFSFSIVLSQDQKNDNDVLLSLPLRINFSANQYKGGIQNWCITQDHNRFIFVANNYGLLEYDGANWTKHRIKNQTKLRTVFADNNSNKIYVGGQNTLGYYSRTSKGLIYTDLVQKIPESNRYDEIWNFISLNGKIYVNLIDNLISINTDNSINEIEGTQNIGFAIKVDNTVFFNSKNGGIYRLNDNEKVEEIANTKSFNDDLRFGFTHNNKTYLFSYNGSVLEYSSNRVRLIESELTRFLKLAKVNNAIQISNGNLVFATQNNGIIIANQNLTIKKHYTKSHGLSHRTAISLYEDNFQNLWVGLNNGIEIIELGSPFSIINEEIGMMGTGYSAVLHQNKFYFGTSSGLFSLKSETEGISNSKFNYEIIKGSEGLVNNLASINNQLFISHHEGGFTLNKSELKKVISEGTWNFKKTKEHILSGTYEGLIFLKEKDNGWDYDTIKGLNESSRIYEFANDSILWMSHGYKGAFKVHFDPITYHTISVNKYGSENGFPSDILINVYKYNNELFFTGEKGLFTYNEKENLFQPHQFLNDWFGEKHISKIAQGNKDVMFYIADGELGYLKQKTLGVFENKNYSFKKVNHFINNDLENISIVNEHIILIGAKEGFIRYDMNKDIALDLPFNTFIKQIEWTNKEDSSFKVHFPLDKNIITKQPKSIRFSYASPYFDGLDRLSYSYRLYPYEKNWSEWTSTSWKEYTNLSTNHYSFEVKARNIYGNESEVAKVEFKVTPPFYSSNIAYLIYAIIGLSIYGMILYSREKKYKNEKEEINVTKNEEIKKKQEEIDEFSIRTNKQIEALKEENLKKELVHRDNQLATVTMHLLSKNEFVRLVRKKLNEALKDLKYTTEINRIIKSIDKNIQEDDGWETFAYHFDQVHEDFLQKINKRVKLTPQETKLCAYLRMNMSTKDIANLMNITVRGVELARYRLRKKLGLDRNENLSSHLSDI